jgi:16S rRNA (cytosine1402-N4)-methyltransferase
MADNKEAHIPVLYSEVLTGLNPRQGENYLDLTGGYGGHAAGVLHETQNYKDSVLVDRDATAVRALERQFGAQGAEVKRGSFCEVAAELIRSGRKFDLVLGDFGVSSVQLDTAERGFSFSQNAALDMRMDDRQELTAHRIVNKWRERELAQAFVEYGEARPGLAKKVAGAIVRARPIDDTTQLASIISKAVGGHTHKHPATKYFQAIRIVVNDELGEISRMLAMLPELLSKGGRVGLISFHSLEDRLVKRYFKDDAEQGLESKFEILTKSPLVATPNELVINPRARSAKLRIARRK